MCYNGTDKKKQWCQSEQILKKYLLFGLFFVTQGHEVGIASNRILERYGEYVFNLVQTARHATGYVLLFK